MSASLVGSEMCIRDRQLGTHPERRSVRSVRSPSGSVPPSIDSVLSIFPSVSYTHLTLPTICSV
eukprot:7757075-Alexandrium_andersonii.AAC.1